MQVEPVARPNALALHVAQDADRAGSALMPLAIDDLDPLAERRNRITQKRAITCYKPQRCWQQNGKGRSSLGLGATGELWLPSSWRG